MRAFEVIDARGVDAIYCLGDIVGYGADPVPCVELVQARCAGVVLGNHDIAVATGEGIERLPRDGQAAALHNQKQLSQAQRDYLASLPLIIEEGPCTFVHATPREPETWARIGSFLVAKDQFAHFKTDFCFIGHTHLPSVMSNKIGVLRVRKGHRYLINVGSVGQPRDHDTRLGVGFFDTETVEYTFVREPYAIEQAAARILGEGLPKRLAKRLRKGE